MASFAGAKLNGIILDGKTYTVNAQGVLVELVVTPAPPPPPPPPPNEIAWAGTWDQMDATQEVDGKTTLLQTFEGRANCMRAECFKVGSKSPTKANREKHLAPAVAKQGDTLICGYSLWIDQLADVAAFRTWIDTESLSATSNEGSRLSDKSLHLAFNEKWASGANRVDMTKPAMTLKRWIEIEFENRMHKTSGLVLIRMDGQEVLRWGGATMGPDVDRIQFGPASDDKSGPMVCVMSNPWYRLKKAV